MQTIEYQPIFLINRTNCIDVLYYCYILHYLLETCYRFIIYLALMMVRLYIEVFPDMSGGSITKLGSEISSPFSRQQDLLGEGWEYTSTIKE